MEKIGSIEIRVSGTKGKIILSPDNYDVKEIISMLQNVEDLLYPSNKKERPVISYNIEEGSVIHVFKTSIQAIIGFSAILVQINKLDSIDFLDLKTAQAIESIQTLSYQKDFEFEIKTSVDDAPVLKINSTTSFFRTENVWVDADLYFYGTLTDAGGKNKANIHLDTEDFGLITIDTQKSFLKDQDENLLYRKFGVRVAGKQNIQTGEIDRSSLKLIGFVDFSPKYDDKYLKGLILKAKNNWKKIDPDLWIDEIRGEYDA
jgi:hypothetical protein